MEENQNLPIEPTVETATDESSQGGADNLLKALEKERKARKEAEALAKAKIEREQQLESELSKMKEIDPEKYWNLVNEKKERDEAELLKKRQYEELRQRYQTETQEAKQREQEAYNRLNDLMVDTTVKEAFFSAGGRRPNYTTDVEGDPTPLESVMSYLKPRLSVRDGKVVILDRSGNPELNKDGMPKSVEEKMLEFRRGTLGVFFADDSTASGGGMKQPTGNYKGQQVPVYTREQVRQGKASIDAIASGKAIVMD